MNIKEFIEDYQFELDGNGHMLNEYEKVLLQDAICSFISDTDFDHSVIDSEVIQTFSRIIKRKGEFFAQKGNDINEMNHLLWMLRQLEIGIVHGYKAHEWLGYIKGVLYSNGFIESYDVLSKVKREFTDV